VQQYSTLADADWEQLQDAFLDLVSEKYVSKSQKYPTSSAGSIDPLDLDPDVLGFAGDM